MKIAFRQLCVPLCGRFGPDEGGVAGYVDRIGSKCTAKWGAQMAGMNFQTDPKSYMVCWYCMFRSYCFFCCSESWSYPAFMICFSSSSVNVVQPSGSTTRIPACVLV
ncbi:MAG: hypothetical protein E7244_19290 [Enterocloster citroniae]|nr:hypothetical protein [Enterocloster citroniae]